MAAVANVAVTVDATKAISPLKRVAAETKKVDGSVRGMNQKLQDSKSSFKQTGAAAKGAAGSIRALGASFAAALAPMAALSAAAAFLGKSLAVASERESDIALLRNGLSKLGRIDAFERLQKQADAFGNATLFNQEDFTAGAGLLTSFTDISIDSYKRVIAISSDLAQTNKGAVKDSLLQVAKALNAPSKNLTALSRSGIQFTEQQKQVIEALEETGNKAAAQKLILEELETQYGGNAKAAAQGFAGAQDTLNESFRDFQEVIGKLTLPATIELMKGLTVAVDAAGQEVKELEGSLKLLNKDLAVLGVQLPETVNNTLLIQSTVDALAGSMVDLISAVNPALMLLKRYLQLRGIITGEDGLDLLDPNREKTAPLGGYTISPDAKERLQGVPDLPSTGKGVKAAKQRKDMTQAMLALLQKRMALEASSDELGKLELDRRIRLQQIMESSYGPVKRTYEIEKANHTMQMKTNQIFKKRAGLVQDMVGSASRAAGSLGADLVGEAIAKNNSIIEAQAQRMQQLYSSIGDSIKTGIVDSLAAAVDGTKSLAEVAQDTLRSVANILLNFGLDSALGGLGGGDSKGILGSLFGGRRAGGGPVSAGKSYMVGESGPEMFVPSSNGSIATNKDLGGGTVVNITNNIADGGAQTNASGGQSSDAMNKLSKMMVAVIQREQRPGGVLSRR